MTSSPGTELKITLNGTDLWLELGDPSQVRSLMEGPKGTSLSAHRMVIGGAEIHLTKWSVSFSKPRGAQAIIRDIHTETSYHRLATLHNFFDMAERGKPDCLPDAIFRFLYCAGVIAQAMTCKRKDSLIWPILPIVKGDSYHTFRESVRTIPYRDARGHWSHY